MNQRQIYFGWALAIIMPLLLFSAWLYIPWPGAIIAAIGLLGLFAGYMIYEYLVVRKILHREVVFEQIALAIFLLVIFSFAL